MPSKHSSRLRSLTKTVGLLTTVSVLLACSNSEGGKGALDVTWKVNGTQDSLLCDQNTGWVVVQVSYQDTVWWSSNAPCHSFHIPFSDVGSGDYVVNATLFNAGNNVTLGTPEPHAVRVDAGVTTTDTLEFTVPTN